MGALGEAIARSPKGRTGRKSSWPEMAAALPEDAVEDLLAAFLDPTIEIAQVKRVVEENYDVPIRGVTTWRNWATTHRDGQLV